MKLLVELKVIIIWRIKVRKVSIMISCGSSLFKKDEVYSFELGHLGLNY